MSSELCASPARMTTALTTSPLCQTTAGCAT
jgi:hypothetical protein